MKRFLLGSVLALSFSLLSCNDNSSSGPDKKEGGGIEVPCNAENEGEVVSPADSDKEYICKNSSWNVVDSSRHCEDCKDETIAISSSSSNNNVVLSAESSSSVIASETKQSSSEQSTESSNSEDGDSSSSVETTEDESSSSEETEESSSSEETAMFLCDDGVTYVLDLANCETESSSSDNAEESSSSEDAAESSSSEEVEEDSSSSEESLPESSSMDSESSSSEIASSSSEKIPSKIYDCGIYDCITTKYLNPDVEYGEYLDSRDNQVYRTVQIGEQTWMAQNLNYASNESRCFSDALDRCAIVGRLYHWADAIRVCPEGWHLPDTTEYNTLVDFVTKDKPDYSAMNSLSSKSTKNSEFKGYDFFGFSIIHGSGFYWYSEGIYDTGALFRAYSYFWTASESNRIDRPAENYARIRSTYSAAFSKPTEPKVNAYSVRCIKD